MKRILRVLVALAIAAPIVCQDEATPYFSLSSNRTFGSHDRPTIMLSGWHVPAVQIRVYRVKDATNFFKQLEDAHSFGGRVPRPEGEQEKEPLIERLYDWKSGLRRHIRHELRAQFTESPRAYFAKMRPAKRLPPGSAATYFAQAPVLNQEQLVLSFLQPLANGPRWDSAQVPIEVKDKGVFLVEAVHGDLRAYTILVVSDVVLVTKTGRDHVLGFLADRDSGEPIANASIAAMTRNGQPTMFTTSSDGLANLPNPSKLETAAQDLRLVATRGADVAFADISSWAFTAQHRNWTGYIYTDRPVYRPGDAMHFRGILRLQAAVGYEIPARQAVSVEISDPDGKPVYQKSLTTNSIGTIHDEFAITRRAALGNYSILVRAGESEMSGNFDVEEYKKPEYEVRVTPAKPRVLEGETVQAVIDARYYFGEPVNGAKVKYSIYRSGYWFPLWYEPDEEEINEGGPGQYEDAAGEQISEAQGQLDSDGKLTIDVPTTLSDDKLDYRYRIEAAVTDQAGREISGAGWLIATYGSFIINIEPQRYFFEPSTTAEFKVEARDYDNKPVTASVHVELATWNWRKRSASDVKSSTDVTTDANGSAMAQLQIPAAGGSYRVRATAPTPEGRVLEEITYIWVAGGTQEEFFAGPARSIQVVPDKKTYRPGDTAKILIVTGQANTPVLVTVEGRDIRAEKLIRSQGATALFEYSVSADDEPGFFVSAQFVRKGQMYQGQKRVKVPPDDHKLNVKLATDKPQYSPGQTATYDVDVTALDGRPVAQADFSLGVVDEAIYAIRPDQTPDIVNFFYGREWDNVFTENSLTFFFNGEAGTRRMRLAELRHPSQLAQLKPERLVLPKVRKAFPDTAFWVADLTTDNAGRAQARVPFPDSLTTWRATARGVAPDERFGDATLKTIIRKNLIVRLAVPRFFVQGDEVTISGIVHNYLTDGKKARVSVKLEGLDLTNGPATEDVEVASRSEVKVDWRVKAQLVRHAKITAEALTDEESDALELELPINPPGVSIRQAKAGTITNSGSTSFVLTFPPDAISGSRSLSIRLSPSIAGSLFSALEYLTSFPYGCVEQTMSSFLPNIMVTKAVRELGLKEPIDQAALDQKIQSGLERLYNFQHDDGGWGWWQSDESDPFMTAYVVAGLSEARSDGVAVNDDAISKGAAWVQKELSQNTKILPDLRAYMGYALAVAGHPDAEALNRSYQDRSNLSSYGIALLGVAFEQVKDNRSSELAGQLEKTVKQNEAEAWWPATRDEMLDFEADVTPETTAYAMKLLTHERSNSPLLPKAALWLLNHRNEGYWWSSTKQTAMVIYGLIDYLKSTNELHPNFSAAVSVNGQAAVAHAFRGDAIAETTEIELDESKLQQAANQVQVSSTGQGRLYYSVSAIHYSNAARFEKQGAISLNILRDYFRLSPGKNGDRIVYDLSPLTGTVAQGDTIAVRLTVTGSEWRYLMMEDPIPAGTEFIEQDNLYELRDKPPWWEYWFTRRELHDDRMAIFQTFFNEGQRQYFYLLKVVNPGLFHVSPARVQPMYQPGTQATTEARMLEVR